jgi:orotidine-5'-phosphate decarboxylase
MKRKRDPNERLIVALDFATENEAFSLVEVLFPDVRFFKVGLELFVASGPSVVSRVRATGAKVFLDLKLHDIPNTLKGSVSCAARLGAAIISLHLSVGREGLKAAVEGLQEASRPTGEKSILAGVTVLTSLGSEQAGGTVGSVLDQVLRLSRLAKECGIDGIITSVREAAEVRVAVGDECVIITPGIRRNESSDDHKRTGTVRDALAAGADYLVVGRPITRVSNPQEEARRFLDEIAAFDAID